MGVIYEDFTLQIEPGPEGGWRVKARSPAGEGSSPLDLPDGLTGVLQPFTQLSRHGAANGDTAPATRTLRPFAVSGQQLRVSEVGHLLFRALFAGPVRQLYDRSCGSRPDPRRGLRIKIQLDPDATAVAALCNLPWELLYRAETKDFLGLSRLNPVVRYLEVPRPTDPIELKTPLRILVVASSPHAAAPLDLEQERRLIEAAWPRGGSVEIEFLDHADTDSLYEALHRNPFNVLHFMGHGTFDPSTGNGSLLLETADGQPQLLSGEVLANLLKEQAPQLVVLNACESALSGEGKGGDFWSGVATALVMGEVPAVVAMRAPISDRSAITFSKALYRELAAGQPVDGAVAEGRLALYRAIPDSLEWATPVLFLRVPDGRLFGSAGDQPTKEPRRDEGNLVHTVIEDSQARDVNVTGRIGPPVLDALTVLTEVRRSVTRDVNVIGRKGSI